MCVRPAVYPDLSSREMVVAEDVINRGIGVQLETSQMADLLSRMQLQAEAVESSRAVRVLVPPTRSDVLHACDVMEVSHISPLAHDFQMSEMSSHTGCWLRKWRTACSRTYVLRSCTAGLRFMEAAQTRSTSSCSMSHCAFSKQDMFCRL